jgi:C4-dicarboxylate-specific signal transduction histidine kinase
VVKASQAVSREIVREQLIDTLMTIALEHADADRGMLVLLRGGEPRIEAEARTEEQTVLVALRQDTATPAELPISISHTVMLTRQSVILDDIRRATVFAEDEYLRRHDSQSLLCLPQRAIVLELLASQAAISVENARLYAELINENRDRRRAEEALRESEASLAEGQRISRTGSWHWNVTTGEFRWSVEHFHLFGLNPAAVQPSYRTFIERVHSDDRPAFEQTIAHALEQRGPFQHEYRIVLPDGSVRHQLSLGHPKVTEAGDLEYAGTIMDITGRKQSEDALRNAQAELARVTRVTTMGELAASIAHEINQLLGAIVANANASLRWLDREKPDFDEARSAISRIANDGMRAAEVIRSLRALAKRTGPDLARLDINDAIREVLALTHSERQRHRVELRTDLFTGDRLVFGDRVQLQQVMLNLIMNAVEAMSIVSGRPRILAISSGLDEGGGMIVTVEDTGTGLDQTIADRIFDPFFTTKPNGMGMGLTICRSIIEAHGGRFWASPRRQHGMAFRLTVPAAPEAPSANLASRNASGA